MGGERDLSHVDRERRLEHAVAVLLQSQTFPLHGKDLEKQLEQLLQVKGKVLAQALRFSESGSSESGSYRFRPFL